MKYQSMFDWQCSICGLGVEYRLENGIQRDRCSCDLKETHKIVEYSAGKYRLARQDVFKECTLKEFQHRDMAEKGLELDIFDFFGNKNEF